MTRGDFKKRIAMVENEISSRQFEDHARSLTDAELLAMIDSLNEGDISYGLMTDEELELLASGSTPPKVYMCIINKHKKRR